MISLLSNNNKNNISLKILNNKEEKIWLINTIDNNNKDIKQININQ